MQRDEKGRFMKGSIPHNKGKKWNDYLSNESQEKLLKTRFKRGNKTWNTRLVGSERIDAKDGYVLIKVAEPNKWKLKHRYIYEQHFGEIPKGYSVIFKDGNKYNFDLDNLALISKSELLILNKKKLISENKEVTETGILIAKVLDKTNKLSSGKMNNMVDEMISEMRG